VARRFGVPVDRITLFLFGGVSNIEREPPSATAEFLTAAVGPVTSIVLGVVLMVIGALAIRLPADLIHEPVEDLSSLSPVQSLLLWLGPINVIVGVFNLIPGFPLDGGRILRAAIWGITKDLHAATWWASAVGQAIGWGLVFVGIAIVFGAHVPLLGSGVVAGLWLAFIGWFLSAAAAQTRRRQLVREVLEGVSVSRLVTPLGPVVSPHIDLDMLVEDWMIRSGARAFPVVDDEGAFVGLVTFADLRRVPREEWETTAVAQIMTPRSELVIASPRDDLADAADKLARADVSQLPVVDPGQTLVGLLLRRDVLRWIELHLQQGTRRYAH
jgi:Zn-dependent protease/predicted transcriptional regulator